MVLHARVERYALADLLARLGPDAPTLCAGWSTQDLAAHLVLRHRRPDAALGIVLPLLAAHRDRVQERIAARPWTDLVALVRTGPPLLSPLRVPAVAELADGVEYFVHHEDVRRAQPGWEVRPLDADEEELLWRRLRRMARPLLRRAGVGVVLEAEGRGRLVARAGEPTVVLRGAVGELLLFAFGRGEHARVELEGDDASAGRLRAARLGI